MVMTETAAYCDNRMKNHIQSVWQTAEFHIVTAAGTQNYTEF